jgi:hypothetical protein
MGVVAIVALAASLACKGKPVLKRKTKTPAVEYVTTPTSTGSIVPAAPPTVAGVLEVKGPRDSEREPNGDSKQAQPIASAVIAGQLSNADDVDMYALTVTEKSHVNIAASSLGDLVITVRDAAGKVVAKSDRGGAKVQEGMPNLALDSGRYTIGVTTFVQADKKAKVDKAKDKRKADKAIENEPNKNSALNASIGYELSAGLSTTPPVAGAEFESNGEPATSNELFLGDSVTGYVGWANDVDVWKLSTEGLAARNAIDVEVSGVDGLQLSLMVADAVGRPMTSKQSAKGRGLTISGLVPTVTTNAPPFCLVFVRADRSNPVNQYRLVVKARLLSSNDEQEPNDTDDSAQPMTVDAESALVATISGDDVDSYSVAPASRSRSLKVTTTPKAKMNIVVQARIGGPQDGASQANALERESRSNQRAQAIGGIVSANHKGEGSAEVVSFELPAGAAAVIRVSGKDRRQEGGYEIRATDTSTDAMPPEQPLPGAMGAR